MRVFTESTWWQLLILFGSLSVILALLSTIIIRIVCGVGGVQIGKTKIGGNIVEGHRTCPRHRDFMLVSHIAIEAARKMLSIDKFDTLRDQMCYAEQCIAEIRGSMLSRFLKLLKETKGSSTRDGLLAAHESNDYSNILRILTFELRDRARTIFSENHLADMKETDFESYVNRRVKNFSEFITELLNVVYPHDVIPSRESVYDSNMDIEGKVSQTLGDMIRRGRLIAFEKKEELKKLQDETDQKIEGIIG